MSSTSSVSSTPSDSSPTSTPDLLEEHNKLYEEEKKKNFLEFSTSPTIESIIDDQLQRKIEIRRRTQVALNIAKNEQTRAKLTQALEDLKLDEQLSEYDALVASSASASSSSSSSSLFPDGRSQHIGSDSSKSGSSSSDESIPFEARRPFSVPEQQYVVLNIAGRKSKPMCEFPACRILSVQPDEMSGFDKGREIYAQDSSCSIWMFKIGEPIVLASKTENQLSKEYCENHIKSLQELHKTHRDYSQTQYSKDLEKHEIDYKSADRSISAKLTQAAENYETMSRTKLLNEQMKKQIKEHNVGRIKPLSRFLETRGQTWAVISFLEDIGDKVVKGLKDSEPVLYVWAAFETEQGANAWIEHTASKEVKDMHLYTVNMYEFLFPTKVDTKALPIKYRDSELDNIMNGVKKQDRKAKDYQEWVEETKDQVKHSGPDQPNDFQKPDLPLLAAVSAAADADAVSSSSSSSSDASPPSPSGLYESENSTSDEVSTQFTGTD